MKKQKLLVFLVLMSILLQPLHTQAATKPNTRAHAYVVMDAHSGEVLLQNNADKKIYPASTVKLMTALVVLDLAPITKSLKVAHSAKNPVASDV